MDSSHSPPVLKLTGLDNQGFTGQAAYPTHQKDYSVLLPHILLRGQQMSQHQFMGAKTWGSCVAWPKKGSYGGGRKAHRGRWQSLLAAPSATAAGGLFPLGSACRAPHRIRPFRAGSKQRNKQKPKPNYHLNSVCGILTEIVKEMIILSTVLLEDLKGWQQVRKHREVKSSWRQ